MKNCCSFLLPYPSCAQGVMLSRMEDKSFCCEPGHEAQPWLKVLVEQDLWDNSLWIILLDVSHNLPAPSLYHQPGTCLVKWMGLGELLAGVQQRKGIEVVLCHNCFPWAWGCTSSPGTCSGPEGWTQSGVLCCWSPLLPWAFPVLCSYLLSCLWAPWRKECSIILCLCKVSCIEILALAGFYIIILMWVKITFVTSCLFPSELLSLQITPKGFMRV